MDNDTVNFFGYKLFVLVSGIYLYLIDNFYGSAAFYIDSLTSALGLLEAGRLYIYT